MVHVKETLSPRKTRGADMIKGQLDTEQDDFFIIGPNYERCAPSIAYRNKLKRRALSASPVVRKRTRSPPVKQVEKVVSITDEAVQTGDHRKALEDEIRRIREDLERRKRELRQRREKTKLASQKGAYQEKSEKISHTVSAKPDAESPRRDGKIENNNNHRHMRRYGRRPRSLSPTHPRRLTEYQRAYQAPDKSCFPQRFTKSMRERACSDKLETALKHTFWETEYQHEYKPFKYVTENEFRSTCVEQQPATVNLVLISRPRTAGGSHGKRVNRDRKKKSSRPRTPDASSSSKRTGEKYLSEYEDKYRSYSNLHKLDSCEDGLKFKQLKAEDDVYKDRSYSHFSRDHLAQLDSDFVNQWDTPSSDRYTRKYDRELQLLNMPAAGMSSTIDNGDRVRHPSRNNHLKFDSTNIYLVMEQGDAYSDCENTEPHENFTVAAKTVTPDEAIGNNSTEDVTSFSRYSPRQYQSSLTEEDGPSLNEADNNHDDWTDAHSVTGSISPLSLESMASNASVASRTLDKARRARDHQFALLEYENRPYSPQNYTGEKRR